MKMVSILKGRRVITMTDRAWVRLPMRALHDERITPSMLCVLAVLIDKCDGGSCSLSRSEIAAAAAVSTATAARAVKQLSECGYIAASSERGQRTRYTQLVLEPKRRGGVGSRSERSVPDVSKYEEVVKLDMARLCEKEA